jgi:hypothetical protein
MTALPKIDRRAVLLDAHSRWRHARSKGWHRPRYGWDVWTWGRCLRLSWAAARQRRDEIAAYHAVRVRGRPRNKPFPIAA